MERPASALTSSPVTSDSAVLASKDFFARLLRHYGKRDFSIRFWDGSYWEADAGVQPRFTMVLQHPGAVRAMFWPPNKVALGEAYIYDDFDIEGDIHAFFDLINYLRRLPGGLFGRLRLARTLFKLPSGKRERQGRQAVRLSGLRHSRARDKQAISYHYDVSNDFYALWLDNRMVYSCAYFHLPDDDLDTAQEQKLDHICRKLRLKPGERLLDIGCGWGGLILHAARHYGVDATGITLSKQQVELAAKRIHEAGLQDQCRVEFQDYRDVNDAQGFDKLVSVGMFEHVGEALLPTYFKRAFNLLKPGGVFLNHGIALHPRLRKSPNQEFGHRYVFPDGEILPIGTTLLAAERAGFEVRDVESLREHYWRTLRHWVSRLESRADEARQLTDDVTYRVWRLYMAGSAEGFYCGRANIFQSLLLKPEAKPSQLPLTRRDWDA
ncbi:MAG TPA: cyclopropane-fatty-acyl-phospholipid synthase family protein [Gemmataceae bacterium]|nr:cyclopropane-fatty-acyl-phospholipid synthase family protein [Gemmataceae bacterium]